MPKSSAPSNDSGPPGPAEIRRSHLELGALPTAVPCARLHAKQVVWEWGLVHLSDTVELIVSELVTNALRAMAGYGTIRMWLSSDSTRVLIEVWDGDPSPPVLKPPGDDGMPDVSQETGRGLFLVDMLSVNWNWQPSQHHGGKVVWAEVGDRR